MKESLKDSARLALRQDDEIIALKAELYSIKSNRDTTFQKDRNIIAKLQGDIGDLEAELYDFKTHLSSNLSEIN